MDYEDYLSFWGYEFGEKGSGLVGIQPVEKLTPQAFKDASRELYILERKARILDYLGRKKEARRTWKEVHRWEKVLLLVAGDPYYEKGRDNRPYRIFSESERRRGTGIL